MFPTCSIVLERQLHLAITRARQQLTALKSAPASKPRKRGAT
jgi:hypothetical protein